ncbi:MAG: hypothetical protein ACFFF4_08895 [Candidatus Thorarchaeota archaeon]
MKEVRFVIIWGLVTLLLVSSSWNPHTIGDKEYILSDDQGPEFDGIGDFFADLLPNDTHQGRAQLNLFVSVYDTDGIDTVIGSYKDINGTVWSNVTLSLYGAHDDGWMFYSGRGENVTLGPEMRIKIWNVKYYANDSLGNWNVSDVGRSSYYLLGWEQPPPNPASLIGSVIGIVGIFAIVLLVWRMRRNQKHLIQDTEIDENYGARP